MSETLLVLGGAEKTRPLVRYARSRGIHVLLCDRNENPPCREDASEFVCISTTDLPALRSLIESRHVDGVVSFGSDMMAIIAARLSAEFGLPGNPLEATETLVQKDRFRRFLCQHGFHAPRALGTDVLPGQEAREELRLPVVVKPADGAGSTAVTRVNDWVELKEPFQQALTASRNGRVVIEEFLDRDHPHMVGGDIFVDRGKVIFWGFLNSHRANPNRPFLPTGTSFPLAMGAERIEIVQGLLQQVVSELGLSFGGFNLEVVFCGTEQPYLIELAPRNGGNRIPELLKIATGFDLSAALVEASVGRDVEASIAPNARWVANYMLQPPRSGRLGGVELSNEIDSYLREVNIDVSCGEKVDKFKKAPDAVGTVFLEFNDQETMNSILPRLDQFIRVKVYSE